jgi:hypothetical protein
MGEIATASAQIRVSNPTKKKTKRFKENFLVDSSEKTKKVAPIWYL